MRSKTLQNILNALTGWLIGILSTLGLSSLWLKIYPAIDRAGQGPGSPIVLLIILALISPFALAGGFIGGRLPKEGGRRNQFIYSAIFGLFLTIPFACFILWYTGF